jgi:hypothetical protein
MVALIAEAMAKPMSTQSYVGRVAHIRDFREVLYAA